MAVIENSVEIARPVEDVFDFAADMRNELKWNPDCESMEMITAAPIGVGTRFRAKWHTSPPIVTEVTEYERPRRLNFHNDGPIEVDLTVSFTASARGTHLQSRFDARPHGLFRLVFPVFLLILKRQEKTNMVNLKRHLETAQ